MPFIVYIIYSKLRNKYYIGFTGDDICNRLKKHNASHKGFTGRHADWGLMYTEQFTSKEEAIARERQIKNWKSRKKIQQLISAE